MNEFLLYPEIVFGQHRNFLKQNVQCFYHLDYIGYKVEGNPDFLNYIKNQFNEKDEKSLSEHTLKLEQILNQDISRLKSKFSALNLVVCVVPRAKKEEYYYENQKLFRSTVAKVVNNIGELEDGTKYIIRHTNTRTTHISKDEYAGEGSRPYDGITKDTCTISNKIKNRNILLIDDIYTSSINVDEDAIQALYDFGAKKVILYTVAKTKSKDVIFNQ